MDVVTKIFSTQDAIFLVSVSVPKPTPAQIASSIAHGETIYALDEVWGRDCNIS